MKANHDEAWVPVVTGRGETEVHILPGQFIFGRKSAAKELRMPGSSITDRMKKLQNLQNLVVEPDTHFSLVTIINWHTYQATETQPVTQAVTQATPIRHPSDTNKNDKNDKNKNKVVLLPDWLDEELWKDFKDHRKKLGKPMTERAEELVIKKAEFLKDKGHNPRHLMLTAIESGWQTVYEPRT